ncbi:MAG: hypothetical protein JNJ71_02015 [Rubrivivax sp.]|nr:hypothetical protein [Rubrivivax sp.]
MVSPYLPEWATLAEACEWLQAETGEQWPIARLLAEPVSLGVWLAPEPDWTPLEVERIVDGRREGCMLPVIFAGDRERLAVERSGGVLSMTRTPSNELMRFDPPIPYSADEFRASAESLRAISQRIREGKGVPNLGRVSFDFGGGARVSTNDPYLLAMLQRHGPDALNGATVEVLSFVPMQPEPTAPLAEPLDSALRDRLRLLGEVRLAQRPADLAAFEAALANPDGGAIGARVRLLQLPGYRVWAALGDAEKFDHKLLAAIDAWADGLPTIEPLPPAQAAPDMLPAQEMCAKGAPEAALPAAGAQDGNRKWDPERIAEAREMRERLRNEGHRNYAAQTAKHYGVSTTRLRELLKPTKQARHSAQSLWYPTAQRR